MTAAQAAGEEAPPGVRSVKVVLVGDGGCGKTSLLMVFADGAFPEVSARRLRLARFRSRARVCRSVPDGPGCASALASEGSPSGAWGPGQSPSPPAIGNEGLSDVICKAGGMAPTGEGCHKD